MKIMNNLLHHLVLNFYQSSPLPQMPDSHLQSKNRCLNQYDCLLSKNSVLGYKQFICYFFGQTFGLPRPELQKRADRTDQSVLFFLASANFWEKHAKNRRKHVKKGKNR